MFFSEIITVYSENCTKHMCCVAKVWSVRLLQSVVLVIVLTVLERGK
jgi:hypothetical protein